MQGRNLPEFTLNTLEGKDFSSQEIREKWHIINVFASWCQACLIEHPLWLKNKETVDIIGIAWRDRAQLTKDWLKRWGNPYSLVLSDPKSTAIIKLGVTGAPETFVVSPEGVIRLHVQGPVSEMKWEEILGYINSN